MAMQSWRSTGDAIINQHKKVGKGRQRCLKKAQKVGMPTSAGCFKKAQLVGMPRVPTFAEGGRHADLCRYRQADL